MLWVSVHARNICTGKNDVMESSWTDFCLPDWLTWAITVGYLMIRDGSRVISACVGNFGFPSYCCCVASVCWPVCWPCRTTTCLCSNLQRTHWIFNHWGKIGFKRQESHGITLPLQKASLKYDLFRWCINNIIFLKFKTRLDSASASFVGIYDTIW